MVEDIDNETEMKVTTEDLNELKLIYLQLSGFVKNPFLFKTCECSHPPTPLNHFKCSCTCVPDVKTPLNCNYLSLKIISLKK